MPDYSSYSTLTVDLRDHGVALVTLNRPDRLNAFDGQMRHEIRDMVQRLSADADVRAVVLTGAGRGFCAGADLAAEDKRMWPTGPAEPTFAWCVELLEMPKGWQIEEQIEIDGVLYHHGESANGVNGFRNDAKQRMQWIST